jgi:transposase
MFQRFFKEKITSLFRHRANICLGKNTHPLNAKQYGVHRMLTEEQLNRVEEVRLDMADSMRKIVRIIDRFHLQKLAHDALQEMRIAHRRDAINQETEAKEQAKLADEKHIPELLENGDSCKQLLAGSRYLLFKSPEKWTEKQKQRAGLLFEGYPDIKKRYSPTHSLRGDFLQKHYQGCCPFEPCRMVQSGGRIRI